MPEPPQERSDPDGPTRLERAYELFADAIEAAEEGTPLEVEALCRAHPALASRLCRLDAEWKRFNAVFDQLVPEDGNRVAGPMPVDSAIERLRDGDSGAGRYRVVGELVVGPHRASVGRRDRCGSGRARRVRRARCGAERQPTACSHPSQS
ncbi:MAG: hypothetical protein GY711_07500 [bacterium]|nr:hypothetical protein [bacterium]